jgi:TonB family protein
MLVGLIVCAIGSIAAAQEAPVITPPALRDFVEASYPPDARAQGLEASVELELTISADGIVTEARVVTPVGNGFDEAAVAAARRFTFEPARRDGVPLAARIRYRYVFELREEVVEQEIEAPRPGGLEGVLLDTSEDPIEGAEIVIASADEATTRRAMTSETGAFVLTDLPAGTYRVSVFADDYVDFQQTEAVAAGEVVSLRYRLEPLEDDAVFSATATVDAPPREVVRRSISREELTRVPGTRGDALRTVELLPGVGRPAFGGGQLIVRGSSPQDSEVFLDGASVPLLYHFGGLTSFFNSRLLERIDFYPGNFSARFGRKIGGVLEVESRDPATDGFHGVLDVNLIDSSLYVEAPIGDEFGIAIGARRSYIDFWFSNVIPSDLFDVVAAPVYYDYQLIASWRPTESDTFRALVYGSSDRFSLIFSNPADGSPLVRGNLDISTQFHRVYLQWKREISDDVDQEVQLSAGPTLLDFSLGPDLRFDATFWQIALRNEWRARLTSGVRLIGGLDINVAPATATFRGPPATSGEGNPDMMLSGDGVADVSFDGVALRPALYFEADLRPFDELQVIAGLRLDYYREIEEWSFDPRLTTIVSVTDTDRIKAGVGIFSQPPEFQESNVDLGNPDLEPIHALHLGLGYERDVDEGITAGVELFYKHLWDRVVGTENAAPPRFTNDGIGRIYGLELSARVEPEGRRWFGFLSYTLSRSERRDHPNDRWRLFDFDQTHILSVAGVVRLGRGWEVGATFRLVTGNPTTPVSFAVNDNNAAVYDPVYLATNSARNPYFHRLDLRVEKLWDFEDWKLALYLDVQNVYNATNPEGVAYQFDYLSAAEIPGLPIIPSLGVRGEL